MSSIHLPSTLIYLSHFPIMHAIIQPSILTAVLPSTTTFIHSSHFSIHSYNYLFSSQYVHPLPHSSIHPISHLSMHSYNHLFSFQEKEFHYNYTVINPSIPLHNHQQHCLKFFSLFSVILMMKGKYHTKRVTASPDNFLVHSLRHQQRMT